MTTTAVSQVFGRLIVVNALVWAATMLTSAVVAKATDGFFPLLLVLVAGASVSSTAVSASAAKAQRLELDRAAG